MMAYIMCGPIGSGKTNIAQTLYGHLPHLNPDNCIKGEWTREKANKAWDEIHEKIRNYCAINLEFVVDSAQALQLSRRRLTQYIREIAPSYKIVCIYVKSPLESCRIRNNTRQRVVPEIHFKEYYDSITNNPPSRADGYDQIIVVDNSVYTGNYPKVWTCDKPWPKDWYHV